MGRTDLDSHDNSPVVGINAKILSYICKHVNTWGFTKALGSKSKVPVLNAAVTYACEYTGESVVLLVNNTLYFEDMKHNLIPPFMIWLFGAEVNECPKCLKKYAKIEDHSIYFPDDKGSDDGYQIPLQLHGTISYFPTTSPTKRELLELPRYNLTPDPPEWNPHTEVYGNQERSMLNYQGQIVTKSNKDQTIFKVNNSSCEDPMPSQAGMHISEVLTSISTNYCPHQFAYNISQGEYDAALVLSGRRKGVSARQ